MKHNPKTCFLTVGNGKDTIIVIKKDEILSLILHICDDDDDSNLIEISTKSCGVRYLNFSEKYDAAIEWFRIMHALQDISEKSTINFDPPFSEIERFLTKCFSS